MSRSLTIVLSAVLLTACTAREPLSQAVVRSEMQRNPAASYIDGLEGKLKWNYTTGLELKAFLDASETPGQAGGDVLEYVDAWYDAIIAEDGTIGVNYKKSNYSTDHICPGRTLFQLYDLTGKEKYRLAMDRLYEQVLEQPRTPEGGFWHKQVYPNQMWLDGLYMAQPFYAEYTARYVPDSLKMRNFADIAQHFVTVADHTFDPVTGLYRHAWDSSHEMFWCDPATGQSAHAWGRALGWYAMALVEVLPVLPADTPGRDEMLRIFRHIFETLPKYADPGTGMWYQVLDRPGEEGNYLEATCSAMFVYAMHRGCREDYLDCQAEAKKAYRSLVKTFVSFERGLVDLNRCCEVAGLGGKENRSGD
ncbi:MAG: glycoside hydrolase family 88 protein, partial [Bacteroidales bacterium]|nr:glycoside hydrolase family 88 protein [Bacteroidales bacterium]